MALTPPLVAIDIENDPDRPNLVWAPALTVTAAPVRLYAIPETVRKFIDGGLNAKIGEYCGLVHGGVPGGDGRGLIGAIALFQGLKRPRIDRGLDENIYIYVTNPDCSYTYPHETRYTSAGPAKAPKPQGAAFVTYVEFGDDALEQIEEMTADLGVDQVSGIIHFWEWVLCSSDNADLPRDHEARYLRRVW